LASVYNQDHFRIRTDATAAQGGTPVWAAAQDVNASLTVGTNFRIRFAISNTGTAGTTHTHTINASRNSGAYAAVTTVTTPAQSVDATAGASADNSAITTQLLTGVGTFAGLGNYDSTGVTGTYIMGAGACYEDEYGLVITAAASIGDTFDFEVFVGGIALTGTYFHIPRITVVSAAAALIASRRLNVLLRR